MAADKNGDGRLDAEELRALLKKHRGTFTDKEVEDLGEMFYAAKAGGSVSYDRFIHALDVKLGDEGEVGLDMVNHLAAGMKPGQINPFFDPEAKLDKMLLKYAHDILDKTPEEVKLRTMGPSGA